MIDDWLLFISVFCLLLSMGRRWSRNIIDCMALDERFGVTYLFMMDGWIGVCLRYQSQKLSRFRTH